METLLWVNLIVLWFGIGFISTLAIDSIDKTSFELGQKFIGIIFWPLL